MYINMTEMKESSGDHQVNSGPPNSDGVLGVIVPVPLPTAASLAVRMCRALCWPTLREHQWVFGP